MTDGNGRIIQWSIGASQIAGQFYLNTNNYGNGLPEDSFLTNNPGGLGDEINFNSPGTWCSANCPAPASCPASSAVFPFAGGNKSTNGFPKAMLATFSPSTSDAPISLMEAASDCDVMGFDWKQTITDLPFAAEDAAGNPLTVPFSDPPEAGWAYLNPDTDPEFANAFPFYYNPAAVPTGCAIDLLGKGCQLPITSSNGRTLNFYDSPGVLNAAMPAGKRFGFTTSLVGVQPGDKVGKTFFTWSWTSTYSYFTNLGGVIQVQTASSTEVGGTGTGGITITSINGVAQTPPQATCTATPNTLWPPDGKLVLVTVSGNITAGTSALTGTTYAVVDQYAQDQPSGNITLGAGGSYSFTVPLIAARNGNDTNGRTYTIYVTGSDKIGNVGACSAVVTVPHDQGQ